MFIFPSRKIRMHLRRLPIAKITLLTIGIFFTAATLVFAQHNNSTNTNTTTNKHVRISPKPTALLAKISPSPKPTRIFISPTPTVSIEKPGIGGVKIQPTQTPSTSTPVPTAIPTTIPTTPPPSITSGGSLIDQVNAYRASQGLSPVQTSSETCSFASTRAQEISTNFSHDGFNSRLSGHTLPYASWSAVTENIAQTSNPQDVVTMWINSPGHAANMRADTPYVCIQQNGQYFAYEGMKQ
jgi:hypothetical protein